MEYSIGLPVVNGSLTVELGSFQGYDENRLLKSLNGRVSGVFEVLCSAAEISRKGGQDFYLGHDGGYMIHSQQNWSGNECPFFSEIGELAWKERTHSSPSRK